MVDPVREEGGGGDKPIVISWDIDGVWLYRIEIEYLKEKEELTFNVEIPNNTYLAIGFGKDM